MSHLTLPTAGLLALTLAAAGGAGQVTLLSQDRSISADAYVNYFTGDDSIVDTDYDAGQTSLTGPWVDTAHAYAAADPLYADAWAEQDSLVSTGRLSGYGYVEFDVDGYASMSSAESYADSLYTVEFQVASSQAYELDVTLAAWCSSTWQLAWAGVELYDAGTSQALFSQWVEYPPGTETTWTSSGTLPAGTYVLHAETVVSALAIVDVDDGWAWFDFTLGVPAPGTALWLLAGGAVLGRRRGA
ncbi:MAG: hypothetical protein ACF8NJ_02670 [Phycisphaerales bacterium JB038]